MPSRPTDSPSALLVKIELILAGGPVFLRRSVGGDRHRVLGARARRWSRALAAVMRDHDGCEIGLQIGGNSVIAGVAREQRGLPIVGHAHRVSDRTSTRLNSSP